MTPSEDAARKSEHEPVSISHSKGESPKQGSHLGKGLEGKSCKGQGSGLISQTQASPPYAHFLNCTLESWRDGSERSGGARKGSAQLLNTQPATLAVTTLPACLALEWLELWEELLGHSHPRYPGGTGVPLEWRANECQAWQVGTA